MAQEWYFIIF